MFNPEIAEKPFLVAFNKMDLPEASENWASFRENLRVNGVEPFCMSAATREGTHEVISAAYELLRKRREAHNEKEGKYFTPHISLQLSLCCDFLFIFSCYC